VVFDEVVPGTGRTRISGQELRLRTGYTVETVIDLTTGLVIREGEPTRRRTGTPSFEAAVVFDAERERMLWSQQLGSRSGAGVLDDLVIVIEVGRRDGGAVTYPGD